MLPFLTRLTRTALLVTSFTLPLFAGQIVHGNWDIINQTGLPVNDFHIEIQGSPSVLQLPAMQGAFPNFVEDTPLNYPGHTFTWSGYTLAPGEQTHVGLTLNQNNANDLRIVNAYWTFNGAPVGDPVLIPGFEFIPAGGNEAGRMRLFNWSSSTMYLGGMSWRLSETEVPLNMLVYDNGGIGTPIANAEIAPGSELELLTDVPIQGGQFFLVQGLVYSDAARTNLVSNFVNEHEHATPEPGTALLLFSAAAIAAGRRFRGGWKSW